MAIFKDLPEELLLETVKKLCDRDRKVHCFDPVGIKDLQHVRLVSSIMESIATPLLFENMVHNEKLMDDKSLTRIECFAKAHPSLACHVRHLQRRFLPFSIAELDTLAAYLQYILDKGHTLTDLVDDVDERHMLADLMDQVVVDGFDNFIVTIELHAYRAKSQTSFRRTLDALPNLLHIEHCVSTDWLPHLRAALSRLATADADKWEESIIQGDVSTGIAPMLHLYSHLPDLATSTVKSLKLPAMPLTAMALGNWSDSIQYLKHLDIECDFFPELATDDEERGNSWLINAARRWNSQLRRLTNLSTLQLTGKGGWTGVSYMVQAQGEDATPVYLDDLIHGGELPRLTSLSLINWPVRESGLTNIIRQYAGSLKVLELHRLSLDITQHGNFEEAFIAWRRIAAVCAEHPTIKRLSFKNLNTHVICDEEPEPHWFIEMFGLYKGVAYSDLYKAEIEELYRVARSARDPLSHAPARGSVRFGGNSIRTVPAECESRMPDLPLHD